MAAALTGCAHNEAPSSSPTATPSQLKEEPRSTPIQKSPVDNLRAAYIQCVGRAFDYTRVGNIARDGNIAAAVERSFADCQTEENALYSVATLSLSLSPPDEAARLSRAVIDNLKARIKARIVREFGPK
jgi:hypothetical protein